MTALDFTKLIRRADPDCTDCWLIFSATLTLAASPDRPDGPTRKPNGRDRWLRSRQPSR
jgi:hypothetical protein